MRGVRTLVALWLVASVARAEGVERREKYDSTPVRLHGAVTLKALDDGGYLSLGGSMLRYMAPGTRNWETLHRLVGDNLYRVAASDDFGRVLAVWETDPFIHLFTLASKKHVTLAKPQPPSPDIGRFHVELVAFSRNGRDALVHMRGTTMVSMEGSPWKSQLDLSVAYRVPLDGSAPELLYRVDGLDLHVGRDVAVYALPEKPGQECTNRSCKPIAAIVAYEFTRDGVSRKVLLGGNDVAMSHAHVVRGSNDDRVVVELGLGGQERALLRWRRGEAEPSYRPFPKENFISQGMYVTSKDEVLEIRFRPLELELRRYPTEGGENVTVLAQVQREDTSVHGIGERGDGSLWIHWGHYFVLLAPGKPPRGFSIEDLLGRKEEWASAAIYRQSPELLWIGIEVGRGRDFIRASFADLEKRAQPMRTTK